MYPFATAAFHFDPSHGSPSHHVAAAATNLRIDAPHHASSLSSQLFSGYFMLTEKKAQATPVAWLGLRVLDPLAKYLYPCVGTGALLPGACPPSASHIVASSMPRFLSLVYRAVR